MPPVITNRISWARSGSGALPIVDRELDRLRQLRPDDQSSVASSASPGQRGGRFAVKAAIPSTRSEEKAAWRQASSSICSPVARSASNPRRTARLAARRATGDFAAISAASAYAAARAVPARHQPVHQAEPVRLVGRHPPPGQHQVEGPVEPGPPGQRLGAAAARDQDRARPPAGRNRPGRRRRSGRSRAPARNRRPARTRRPRRWWAPARHAGRRSTRQRRSAGPEDHHR